MGSRRANPEYLIGGLAVVREMERVQCTWRCQKRAPLPFCCGSASSSERPGESPQAPRWLRSQHRTAGVGSHSSLSLWGTDFWVQHECGKASGTLVKIVSKGLAPRCWRTALTVYSPSLLTVIFDSLVLRPSGTFRNKIETLHSLLCISGFTAESLSLVHKNMDNSIDVLCFIYKTSWLIRETTPMCLLLFLLFPWSLEMY